MLLVDSAQRALGQPGHSPLIGALRAQARTRLFHAIRTTSDVTKRLLRMHAAMTARKQPGSVKRVSQHAAIAS
jgi:hypothetical protein